MKRCAAAEPDVSEPRAFLSLDAQEHVRSCKQPRGAITNSRGQSRDAEADLLQHCGEEEVLFVAVSAAAIVNELPLQTFEVEPDRSGQKYVEILEGNVCGVCQMQLCQSGGRRLGRSGQPNAGEIRGKVEISAHLRRIISAERRCSGYGQRVQDMAV